MKPVPATEPETMATRACPPPGRVRWGSVHHHDVPKNRVFPHHSHANSGPHSEPPPERGAIRKTGPVRGYGSFNGFAPIPGSQPGERNRDVDIDLNPDQPSAPCLPRLDRVRLPVAAVTAFALDATRPGASGEVSPRRPRPACPSPIGPPTTPTPTCRPTSARLWSAGSTTPPGTTRPPTTARPSAASSSTIGGCRRTAPYRAARATSRPTPSPIPAGSARGSAAGSATGTRWRWPTPGSTAAAGSSGTSGRGRWKSRSSNRSRTRRRWPTTSPGSSRTSGEDACLRPLFCKAFGSEKVTGDASRPGARPVRAVAGVVPVEVRRRADQGRVDRGGLPQLHRPREHRQGDLPGRSRA